MNTIDHEEMMPGFGTMPYMFFAGCYCVYAVAEGQRHLAEPNDLMLLEGSCSECEGKDESEKDDILVFSYHGPDHLRYLLDKFVEEDGHRKTMGLTPAWQALQKRVLDRQKRELGDD